MARITSVRAFNMDALSDDWAFPFGLLGGQVRQNEGVVSPFGQQQVYPDSYALADASGEGLIFAGTDFAVNGNANFNGTPTSGGFTAGTVQAVFAIDGFSNGAPQVYAAIEGIAVAATTIQAVARTASTDDDAALLRQVLSGNDTFDLLSNNADLARGFGGNDTIRTNGGADRLWGGAGNDGLFGGNGNDTLRGDDGRDVLTAGAGLDILVGGRGQDILVGGTDAERDVFVFQSRADSATLATSAPLLNIDVIRNFTTGASSADAAGDRVNLDGLDANLDQSGNQDFLWNGSTARAYRVWIRDDGADVLLLADNTGDTVADFAIRFEAIATLAAWNVIL